MDGQRKEQFKWKFYKLAVMLNVIILLFAFAVMGFFIAPETIRIPLVLILLVLAGFLTYSFRNAYYRTKRWLDENTLNNDSATPVIPKEPAG